MVERSGECSKLSYGAGGGAVDKDCRAASVADNTMEKIMREKEFQALDGDKANDVEEN